MSCPIWLGESEFPEGRAGELSIATAEGLWEGWLPQRSCRVFPLVMVHKVAFGRDNQDGSLQEFVG